MALIAQILSKFDDSGIKKAEKGFGGLKKAIGAVGLGIGVSQLVDAAKAASQDAKSQQLLVAQLKRSAHATDAQVMSNEAYIQQLSEQVGIVDDNLRPAMSKFARVTKDVATAQRLLQITLDASAGSGLSQEKVAKAVAKAYTGNTKALQGMFPELKNSKDALGDLAKEFAGFAAKKADPFAKFNVSMDNFKETVGTFVLPMLTELMRLLMLPGVKETILLLGALIASIKILTAVTTAWSVITGFLTGEMIVLDGALTAMGWTLVITAITALITGITYLATQTTFFQDTWTNLVNIFQGTAKVFGIAWDLIKKGFMIAFEFIGKMFKNYVNFWLGLFEGFINFIVDGLNAVVGHLNDVLNGLKTATGGTISLHVSTVPKLKLPRLANGGIVMPSPGGTNVTVGEGGKPEAIVPLNGRNGFGNTINIHVHSADPKAVVDAVGKYVKTNGKVPSSWNLVTGTH
jgi:hypothetical protein